MIYQSLENGRDRERLTLVAPYTSQFPPQMDHLYFTRCNINHITTGIRSHYSPVGTRLQPECAQVSEGFFFFFSPGSAESSFITRDFTTGSNNECRFALVDGILQERFSNAFFFFYLASSEERRGPLFRLYISI